MKRSISIICSLTMVLQLLLGAVPVFAADGDGIGEAYEAPESPAITYNMNIDWKFYDTKSDWGDPKGQIDAAHEGVQGAINDTKDASGKKFYEVGYDDSAWETVSIPHGIGGGTNSFAGSIGDEGGGYRSVLLYRKTITMPQYAPGSKVFFELEGIRQCAYVWVNGQEVGYYEAGTNAMGFDLTKYVKPGEQTVIALLNDGTTMRGTAGRIPYETVPGEKWGSSYTPDNFKSTVGKGSAYQWNMKDFNEPQIGLVYDAYLHIKGGVYQTLPLYNNLKTTGNYIYADNFDIKGKTATIHVDAEVRNETAADGDYTLEVAIADGEGNLKYKFESQKTAVPKASDAGVVYQAAVEAEAYSEAGLANAVGITKVNTPDVTHITAKFNAENVRFWSTDDPYLYTVYTILRDKDGNAVDVQKKETGFRKVTYDKDNGVMINDKACWMVGYAQRSTNEWAVIGSATDWLQDYDMALLKENNSNFIRWMHVTPKPAEVRSSDRYGVAIVVPAGDKEGTVNGRQWSQRVETMRDAMIYFRNSPSVIFWETGNSAVGSAAKANEMAALRDKLDPKGMRFIGARSTAGASDQMNYDYNYAGTMIGTNKNNEEPKAAKAAMQKNSKMGPIMETEYSRNESPRRVWDVYSPPDFDYVNKQVYRSEKEGEIGGAYKRDNYDYWSQTQEDISIANVRDYNGYYSNRAGKGSSLYSAAAMMVWSDSNMHTRNSASENCRTSGRVDPVRQKKEMFEATKAAQSSEPALHIIGHWSYPEVSEDTYNYFGTKNTFINFDGKYYWSYDAYDKTDKQKRNPLKKTVYVIGSSDVSKVELYRVDGTTETLIGTDDTADSSFIYQFDNVDVTQGDAVIAKAYDARGNELKDAADRIDRTGDKKSIRITPHTAVKEDADGNTVQDWRADGSDIAYFDIEVIDEKGNVCAVNYDKINLKWTGDEFGTYLGGYNSGLGDGLFQNSGETDGLSFYFGGEKNQPSTLGKDYVYAENGTNRIFVRSTREAGTFSLTASMDGIPAVTPVSITSVPVETTGGLTTQMQSILPPDAKEAPVTSNVPPMKPLMFLKKHILWAAIDEYEETDTTVYYDVYLNGEKLELKTKAYMGIMDTLFGPVSEILEKVKAAGATGFTFVFDAQASPAALTVTRDGHEYKYEDGLNNYYLDGVLQTEIVDSSKLVNGVLVANMSEVLGAAGITYSADNDNHTINITVVKEGE